MAYDYPNFTGFDGFMSYPTTADPFVWLKVLVGIFFISTFSLFFSDVRLFGKGKILSSLVVAGFFTSVLAVMGSVVGFITTQTLVYIVVFFIVLLGVFFFSSDR